MSRSRTRHGHGPEVAGGGADGPSSGAGTKAVGLVGGLALSTLALGACGQEVVGTLVALPGCGVDGAELSSLQVVARGDFPAAHARPTVATEGTVRLPDLPAAAVAITVEGQFGDITEAVGRTARLDDGDLPIYFAPSDGLCAVDSGVRFRDVGSMVAGPEGDVLLVGGRDQAGGMVADVIHTRDVDPAVALLDEGLAAPTTGMVALALSGRRFAVLGGARSDGVALGSWTEIDLDRDVPVGPPQAWNLPGTPRAYHGAATLADGRILVAGGCAGLDLDSACAPETRHVLGTAFTLDPSVRPARAEPAPALLVPRYDHELLVARDGVVFAVGGRGPEGRGVVTFERWLPGARRWQPFGPVEAVDENLDLVPGEVVVGATLLEGGVVVVALNNGQLGWVTEAASGRWPGWCDGLGDACFHRGPMAPEPRRRRLHALPDERVLADGWILSVALLGVGPDEAVDLSQAPGEALEGALGPRVGTAMAGLADGSVLLAGGRDPGDLAPAVPFLARLRPALDGPDERIVAVDLLEPGSFVLHQPDRVSVVDKRLELRSKDGPLSFPNVWAHVRSFRSSSFRFDVTLEGTAIPHLVLSQGAVAGMSIRFGNRIDGVHRGADGTTQSFTCGSMVPEFGGPGVALRIEVRPRSVVVRREGEIIATCPGLGGQPAALGIGVSDEGNVRAFDMRLTRI